MTAMRKNLLLLGFICSLLLGCNFTESNNISPVQALALQQQQQALIVDVREDQEWQQKHIPGAVHIPLAQLSTRIGELENYKNRPIIAQCQRGGRSAKAVDVLKSAGFTQVNNLDGGLQAWMKAGLNTE